jgi:NADPH:quinone reductase-like Zn-dependent oxidoreductase
LHHQEIMADATVTARKAYRRTDTKAPDQEPWLDLVNENIERPLPPSAVLIKVHAVSLNYRDANIARGTNPWPVLPHGILCCDAAGEVIALGEDVKGLVAGDRVTPIVDLASITGRERERSWLAADVDGVLASFVVFDESVVCKVPGHLDWDEASTLPCAGLTAWSAIKGAGIGSTVLIQGSVQSLPSSHQAL